MHSFINNKKFDGKQNIGQPRMGEVVSIEITKMRFQRRPHHMNGGHGHGHAHAGGVILRKELHLYGPLP